MLSRSMSLSLSHSYSAACCRLQRLGSIRLAPKPLAPAHPARSRNCSTARSQNGEAAESKHQAPKHKHKADAAESEGSSPGHGSHHEQHGHGGHHDGAHGAAHQLQHRAAEKMTFQLLEKVCSASNGWNITSDSYLINHLQAAAVLKPSTTFGQYKPTTSRVA